MATVVATSTCRSGAAAAIPAGAGLVLAHRVPSLSLEETSCHLPRAPISISTVRPSSPTPPSTTAEVPTRTGT